MRVAKQGTENNLKDLFTKILTYFWHQFLLERFTYESNSIRVSWVLIPFKVVQTAHLKLLFGGVIKNIYNSANDALVLQLYVREY